MKMPKLIGTKQWNPYGESILTIIEKLRQFNSWSYAELTQLVGAYGPSTFEANERSDPGRRATLDTRRLLALAGWSADALDASFPAFYRLPDADSDVSDSLFFDLAPSMRLCPSCAHNGLHLLLHQSRSFARCPIHQDALIERCPTCSKPLKLYDYPPDEHHSMGCNHCGWSAFSRLVDVDRSLQNARVIVLDDLGRWFDEVRRAATGVHQDVRLLDKSRRFADITRLHAILGGPDWLSKSLAHAPHLRTDRRVLDVRGKDINAIISPFAVGEAAVNANTRNHDEVSPWSDKFYGKSRQLAKAFHRTTRDSYNPEHRKAGVRLASYGYSIFQSEYASIAAHGFLWWEHCLSNPRDRGQTSVSQSSSEISSESKIWRLWTVGPERLLYTYYRPRQRERRLSELSVQIGEHWFEHVLERLHVAMIGCASITPERPVQPENLLDMAFDIGAAPVTALIRHEDGVAFLISSTMAPEESFRELFASGYTGCDFSLDRTPSGPDPVHELVGLSAERRERSRAALRAIIKSGLRRRPGEFASSSPQTPVRDAHLYGKPRALAEAEAEIAAAEPPNAESVQIFRESDTNTEAEVDVALRPLVDDVRVTLMSRDQESWIVRYKTQRWRLWPAGHRRWVEIDDENMPIGVYHFGTVNDFRRKCILQLKRLPRNSGKVWERHELRLLDSLIARHLPVASIASELGRSTRSVVLKAGSMQGTDLDDVLNLPDMGEMSVHQLIAKSQSLRPR